MTHKPTVVFVCVKNAGKSQLAAALLRQRYGDQVQVHSAGTRPGGTLNAESVTALAEVGATTAGEHPKPLDPQLVAGADMVVLLGPEVELDTGSTPVQRWLTDEPSSRGIQGMERMRLVRDDIAGRVAVLGEQLDLPPLPTERARTDKPTVLFVCVHNAGRSQMAAGYLQHLAGGQVQVRSAGSAPAEQINPAAVQAMAEEGIDITAEQPTLLTDIAVQASDVVITMGCGDACPVYPGKRYEDWGLADPSGQGLETVRPIRDEIRARVTALIRSLGVPAS